MSENPIREWLVGKTVYNPDQWIAKFDALLKERDELKLKRMCEPECYWATALNQVSDTLSPDNTLDTIDIPPAVAALKAEQDDLRQKLAESALTHEQRQTLVDYPALLKERDGLRKQLNQAIADYTMLRSIDEAIEAHGYLDMQDVPRVVSDREMTLMERIARLITDYTQSIEAADDRANKAEQPKPAVPSLGWLAMSPRNLSEEDADALAAEPAAPSLSPLDIKNNPLWDELANHHIPWSKATFGEGRRTLGIVKHIQKRVRRDQAKA